ncbi:MAG: caspase family protein [Rhodobacteraceae bacterium]|nr:caspase family protein [Paracoccaceae bacterium]
MRLILPLLLSLLLALPALAGTRHALVVGIDSYESDGIADLAKAVNDARAVGDSLERIGFQVMRATDLNRRAFLETVVAFAGGVSEGDEVVFYFAGHGVEIDGQNLLLARDVPAVGPGAEPLIRSKGVAVDWVLELLRDRGARVSLVILDACRDNPFPRDGLRSVGSARGLARTPVPRGTFLLYSAGIGQAALDSLPGSDPDPNSVFTRNLLPLLEVPGLSLVDLARELRRDVEALASRAGHLQRPAYYDEMTEDFYFLPVSATASSGVEVAMLDACAPARTVWPDIRESESVALVQEFVAMHGDCPVIGAMARERLAVLEEERAEAAREAARERAERARMEADSRRRSAEMALGLSTGEVRHIRWTLIQLYGFRTTRPGMSIGGVLAIDDTMRNWIGRHDNALNGGWNTTLTRAIADDLLARPFEPQPYAFPERGDLRDSGDWASWRDGGRCVAGTRASGIAEGEMFHLPEIHIWREPGAQGNSLWLDFITPNPFFADSWVEARVDGRRFSLAQDTEPSRPVVTVPIASDGMADASVLRAMRAGNRMQVRGVSYEYGDVAAAAFSLRGFTAAFTRMAEMCGSPQLVRTWLR